MARTEEDLADEDDDAPEAQLKRARDAMSRKRRPGLVEESVNAVDRKDLCFRLRIKTSHLSDAVAERGKHFPARWLAVLAEMLPEGQLKHDLAADIAADFGFAVVELPDPNPQQLLQR